MYLIAKESEKILVYAYKIMDKKLESYIEFEKFKSETSFTGSIDDFRKSMKYLFDNNCIASNFDWKWTDSNFKISLSTKLFPAIEDIIFKSNS